MVGCSDEPDASNFYTFKGQMMSEYLYSHEEFSQFSAILERAGMMELLASYGALTCFPPTNDAMQTFLAKRGFTSIDQLSDADCDTIARTHLVKNMYTTADMDDGVLSTANMNRRYIEVSHGIDEDKNRRMFAYNIEYYASAELASWENLQAESYHSGQKLKPDTQTEQPALQRAVSRESEQEQKNEEKE